MPSSKCFGPWRTKTKKMSERDIYRKLRRTIKKQRWTLDDLDTFMTNGSADFHEWKAALKHYDELKKLVSI